MMTPAPMPPSSSSPPPPPPPPPPPVTLENNVVVLVVLEAVTVVVVVPAPDKVVVVVVFSSSSITLELVLEAEEELDVSFSVACPLTGSTRTNTSTTSRRQLIIVGQQSKHLTPLIDAPQAQRLWQLGPCACAVLSAIS
mmetsp:Transcript_6693/g.11727  ORF Transcript_6693/g.11727 Transcript_6693/m.11727 type:complete len:139 (+) Transcript_6693:215-631(+)